MWEGFLPSRRPSSQSLVTLWPTHRICLLVLYKHLKLGQPVCVDALDPLWGAAVCPELNGNGVCPGGGCIVIGLRGTGVGSESSSARSPACVPVGSRLSGVVSDPGPGCTRRARLHLDAADLPTVGTVSTPLLISLVPTYMLWYFFTNISISLY